MRIRRPITPRLWRRSDGTWYVVWQEGGATVKRSTGTAKRALAEASLAKLQAELAAGWITRDLRLAEAVEEWLAEKAKPRHGIRTSTLRDYRRHCDHLLAVAPAGLRLDEVGPRHLLQVLDRLQRAGAATTSQRKVLTTLAMLYRWHVRMGHVQRNPVDAVDRPRADSTPTPELAERDYLELQGDVAEAIAAADRPDTRRGLEALQDLLEVLWCSGMRRIDALRLRWEDVDLDQAVWTIRAPANKGGLVVLPIHRRLVPLLQRRRLLGGEGPFPGVQAFQSIWRRFKAARPQWAGTSLHSLRTAFITRLRRAGHHEEAKRLARHRSAAMSDLYFRDRPEDWRGVLDLM